MCSSDLTRWGQRQLFPDDMGLDNSVELALANLDPNALVLEPITFDDADTVEVSSATPADAEMIKEQDASEESSGEHDDQDEDSDVDYDDKD